MAKRPITKAIRARRRQEAEQRAKARESRSIAEQLALIMVRSGESRRELRRLGFGGQSWLKVP